MCYDEIGLYAQNTDTILGSIVNTLGGPMQSLKKTENLHFGVNLDQECRFSF